ncbi:ATP-binding domain-containing protein [Streptomyces sp. NPDC055078]
MSTTSREAIVAEEQQAVDHAYDCYEARLAEMTEHSPATASASGKDGIAARKEAEAKAEEYGGLDGEALVVSRVDVREPGEAESETFYIGRRSVSDVRTRDQVVVLWTAPVARKWHNARPESPGEVLLRRQLRCTERLVEDYLDEITPARPALLPAGDIPADPAALADPAARADRSGSASVPRTGDRTVISPRTAAEDARDADDARELDDMSRPIDMPDPDDAPARTDAPDPADSAVPTPEPPAADPESTATEDTTPGTEDTTPGAVPSPRDGTGRRRRKPQQVDEFLLRELHRSRSGRMRDIVETIRRDQMALVTDSPADVLVIQGGPGTGKSAVGLHRVTWLVNNDHFRAQDILVVGPHQSFLEYVGRVLPTLGTRNVNAVQLSRLWQGDVRGTDSTKTRLIKSDDRMATVLRGRVETECRPEALDSLTTAPSHDQDEPSFAVAVGSTSLRLPRSEVLGLLREAREGSGAYRTRRDRFRTLLVDRLLSALVQLAPRRSRDTTVRRDLERNRQVVALVDRTWPALSPEEALRSLLNSPEKLRECAAGVLGDREQAALHRPKAESAADEAWTLDDLVCLEELRFLIAGETPQRYRHIVVDEAQDLTPMQARSLRRRCPTGSMTVLGDLAQATGPHTYAAWGRLGRLLSGSGDWRVAELNTSYRVPAQIMEFVAPLARAVAPALPYPIAVRRSAGEAVRLVPTTPGELLDATMARVGRLVGTEDGRTLRSVAVIVPDDSPWLQEVRQRLDRAEGMTPERRGAVAVLSAAQAKGMEFDHVLVLDPTTIADRGPAGPRLLYVVLTRSTQTLTVLHTSPLPAALVGDDEVTGTPSTAAGPSSAETPSPPAAETAGEPGAAPDTEPQAQPDLKDTEFMNDTATTAQRTAPNQALLQELTVASEADRRCNTHEAVRYELKAALFRAGLRPSDSPVTDVSLVGRAGLFLYEVLGSGHTTYAAARTGATRLLEINHTLPRPADRLYVVLPEPPSDDWTADTVHAVFGVHVLWRTPDGWAGQDRATALGGGNDPAAPTH